MGYHPANDGGIVEDARSAALAQHLVEVALIHFQSVAFQHFATQCRSLLLSHRGQLCPIADEQQAVVAPRVDKAHQVVEQIAAAKHAVPVRETGTGRHH